jgi:hypothetical protein
MVTTLPEIRFAESPATVRHTTAVDAPPFLGGAPLEADASRWNSPIALPEETRQLVGFGSTVVAITPDGMWPAWALGEGGWTKLRGIPAGSSIGDQVGVIRENGFSVVGVFEGRSVIYDYRPDGEFEGARTIRDLEAGAFAVFADGVAVFDANRPVGRLVTTTVTDLVPPGTVVDAASGMGWMVVLTSDGSVHGTQDPLAADWRRLGDGFAALRASERVVAVGENATVGIHGLDPEGMLVRMDRAPFGPTVVSGSQVSVHDWSSDSIWTSVTGDEWERLPLWADVGFHASFRQLVSGTEVPTVLGVDANGVWALWRAAP